MATLCSNDVIVQYVTVLKASYLFIRLVLRTDVLLFACITYLHSEGKGDPSCGWCRAHR